MDKSAFQLGRGSSCACGYLGSTSRPVRPTHSPHYAAQSGQSALAAMLAKRIVRARSPPSAVSHFASGSPRSRKATRTETPPEVNGSVLESPASGRRLPGSRVGRAPGEWGCRARRNLWSKRLNGGYILGHALVVTVEHPPSAIRAMSTDEDVTTDFGAWIVVSARRIAGGQRRGLVGRALGVGVPGARLTHGGRR